MSFVKLQIQKVRPSCLTHDLMKMLSLPMVRLFSPINSSNEQSIKVLCLAGQPILTANL